jgi:hypothetical protein
VSELEEVVGLVGEAGGGMSAKRILLSIGAVVCFAAAYRFGSHGFRLNDSKCVGLAALALIAGLLLLWLGLRNRRPKLP